MTKLIDALKTFNQGSPMWSVPRTDTPAHKTLLRMIRGKMSLVDKRVAEIERRTRGGTMHITL